MHNPTEQERAARQQALDAVQQQINRLSAEAQALRGCETRTSAQAERLWHVDALLPELFAKKRLLLAQQYGTSVDGGPSRGSYRR